MKKLLTGFILLLAFMFALPTNVAFAHSHQESTSPSENEEVTEPVDEITVTFDAGIANGDIEVTNNTTNEEIEPASVEVESTVITAQFDEPLPNGEYIVYWENIGDDTHHIDGEFTFTVNIPEEEVEEGTSEEDTTNEDATEEESTDDASEQETNVEDEQSETDNADSGSAVLWISIILAILFIGGLIGFVVSRNKKK